MNHLLDTYTIDNNKKKINLIVTFYYKILKKFLLLCNRNALRNIIIKLIPTPNIIFKFKVNLSTCDYFIII